MNTSICLSSGDQYNADIVSDKNGGAFIAWVDERNSSLQADIFVQKINSTGFIQWTVNGVSACIEGNNQAAVAITGDGNGGIFLVWNDFRSGDRDVYAQSIDSLGAIRWAMNGVPVCTKPFDQRTPKIKNDGNGNLLIVWEDSTSLNNYDIYAQKLNSTGTPAWTAGGVIICSATGLQEVARIENDSTDGAIIIWQDARSGTDYDIFAQHINNAGVEQWAANGVLVSGAANSQKNPKMKSDGQGGAIIAWQDSRNNGTDTSGIYLQRVDATGQMLWTANGVPGCTAIGNQTQIDMTDSGINGVIISWRDKRGGVDNDIYAQLIDLNGTPAWTQNGIAISNAIHNQANPSICGDGASGAIICWEDERNGLFDIYSQRINTAGQVIWQANGVIVGNAADDQLASKNISDGNGGSIYTWEDNRNGNDLNIYAHHLFQDGNPVLSLSENKYSKSVNAFVFPNPVKANSCLQIEGFVFAGEYLNLTIYNSFGQIVLQQEIRNLSNPLNTEGLSGGLYGFSLENIQGISVSGKFIVAGE